jgi:hypothetical protein
MQNFVIKEFSDLVEAKKWWDLFSPNVSIYDYWDFRYVHFKFFNNVCKFYVGFVDNEPIGLLALQYDAANNLLQFFGGINMECNRVFIKPGYSELVPNFYENITLPAVLTNIDPSDATSEKFIKQNKRYFLDLNTIDNSEDFLKKYFSKQSKHSLERQFRRITEHQLEITEGNLDDLEFLFEFNLKKYGAEATFIKPFRKEIYKELVVLPGTTVVFYTFVVDGQKQGVALAINYKSFYSSRLFGIATDAVPNLWKYTIFKNIEKAKQLGSIHFDIGTGDYGWKEGWGFSSQDQYMLTKNRSDVTSENLYNLGLN